MTPKEFISKNAVNRTFRGRKGLFLPIVKSQLACFVNLPNSRYTKTNPPQYWHWELYQGPRLKIIDRGLTFGDANDAMTAALYAAEKYVNKTYQSAVKMKQAMNEINL